MSAPEYVLHEIANMDGIPKNINSADRALLEQNQIQEDAALEARIAARESAARSEHM